MPSSAIVLEGVSKDFVIRETSGHITLAEQLLHRARNPFARPASRTFHALHDVSFEVPAGSVTGLIGHNGAGKSTLLKILARITPPTRGAVHLDGRVGSLLEVGTGFHPELTGRENVFLNGAILGMSRPEIREQFDAIVEFAGVAPFLELPVKRYSSGMYVRLAFAVAAHLRSEILLVDEVLSVGDSDFQQLSKAKIESVRKEGRTVLLVSHQMSTIVDLCDNVIVLEKGSVFATGRPEQAVARYLDRAMSAEIGVRAAKGDAPTVQSVVPHADRAFSPSEPKSFDLTITARPTEAERFFVAVQFFDADGQSVLHCDSNVTDDWVELTAGETKTVTFTLTTPWLVPGTYWIDVFLCNAGVLDSWSQALWFTVAEELPYSHPPELGLVKRDQVLPDFGLTWEGR